MDISSLGRRGRHAPAFSRSAGWAVVATVALVLAGCGRSAGQQETATGNPSAAATNPSGAGGAPAADASGTFGTEKGICGPGKASGATERGVTDSTITVGTFSDVGSTILPGLGKEFFDVGDAFTAWCNAAGGINGRKIKLVKHDAKLVDAAAQTLQACQTDFMLVGGTTVGDAAAVKPRVACKLAQIPSFDTAPEAARAGLQVLPSQNPPDAYEVGPFNALTSLFPGSGSHLGVTGSNYAAARPQGLRLREALTQSGYTVSAYQEPPPLVANYRPYVEQMRGAGVQGYEAIGLQDVTTLLAAIKDVGWQPKFMVIANQLYVPSTIKAARASGVSNLWLTIDHLPFELANQSPVVKQAKDILLAAHPKADLSDFAALSFSAWVLWAKSATACGSNLTGACVIAKAKVPNWTAGGLYAPRDLTGNGQKLTNCFLLMKVTPNGFVYDRNATKPNSGFYNCDPKNVAKLRTSYQ